MSFTQTPRQMRSISALNCGGAAQPEQLRGGEGPACVEHTSSDGVAPRAPKYTAAAAAALAVGNARKSGGAGAEPISSASSAGELVREAGAHNDGVLAQLFSQAMVHGWGLNVEQQHNANARTGNVSPGGKQLALGHQAGLAASSPDHLSASGGLQQSDVQGQHASDSSNDSSSCLIPTSLLSFTPPLGPDHGADTGGHLDESGGLPNAPRGSPDGIDQLKASSASCLSESRSLPLLDGHHTLSSGSPTPQMLSPELLHLLQLLQHQQQQDVARLPGGALLDPNPASLFNQGPGMRPGHANPSPNGQAAYDEQQAREHMLQVLTSYLAVNQAADGANGSAFRAASGPRVSGDAVDVLQAAALNNSNLLQHGAGAEPEALYQAMLGVARLPHNQDSRLPSHSMFSTGAALGQPTCVGPARANSGPGPHNRQAYASTPGGGNNGSSDTCSWDDLTQPVRETVLAMISRCEPHIKLVHFDGGVRHWLAQLTTLFGENAALSGLAAIEGATNLAGVRNMRAFITCKLIDHFEQHVFQQDPAGYAAKRLSAEQFTMLSDLVVEGNGLQWKHFDPKVLDTIRDLGSVEYVRSRLQRLTSKELAAVQNVPAYIFTLLSKRGKTAKQAAAAKGATEAALAALVDSALGKHVAGLSLNPSSTLQSHVLSPGPGVGSLLMGGAPQQPRLPLQRAWTTSLPPALPPAPPITSNGPMFHSPTYDRLPNPHMQLPGLSSFYPQSHVMHQGFGSGNGNALSGGGMLRGARVGQGNAMSLAMYGSGGFQVSDGGMAAPGQGWVEDMQLGGGGGGPGHSNLGLTGSTGVSLGLAPPPPHVSSVHHDILSSLYGPGGGSFSMQHGGSQDAIGGADPLPHPACQYSTWS